tara:strand:+ start:415 stop:861 length:447 start_codon:yes stop_codon:yes gene_type:complete
MGDTTDNTKTAEENIQAEIDKANEKRAQGDTGALPDISILTPLVYELLGEEKPSLTDALKNIAILFLGQQFANLVLEKGIDSPEVKALLDPLTENLMLLAMTAVSISSLGVIPPPSIPVVKEVLRIIREFEETAATKKETTSSSTSIL